jgi:tetratricopeptide (TPR) repeat protein
MEYFQTLIRKVGASLPICLVVVVMLSHVVLLRSTAQQDEGRPVSTELEGGPRDTFFKTIAEYRRIGDTENAVMTYDLFLEAYPDYGKENGDIVTLLYQRADAHGHDRGSMERLELFMEIWDVHSESPYPQIFNIGRMVVSYAQGSREDKIAYEYGEALLKKLQREYDDYSEEDIVRHGIDIAFQEALYYRSRAAKKLGNLDESNESYRQLMRLFPDSDAGRILRNDFADEVHQASSDIGSLDQLLTDTIEDMTGEIEELPKTNSAITQSGDASQQANHPQPEGTAMKLSPIAADGERGLSFRHALYIVIALSIAVIAGQYWYRKHSNR